jgi:hypothetical protein
MRWTGSIVAVCLLLSPQPGSVRAGDDEVRPYDVGVRVVYGSSVRANEDLRSELEIVLADELNRRGCYRSARVVDSDRREPGQLIFKVRIDRVEDTTEHDIPIAQRKTSDDPEDRIRYDVSVRIRAETGILAFGSDQAIYSKPYRVMITRRPRYLLEDAVDALRAELLDDFAERASKIACKPSAAKLARGIAEATDGS